MSMFGKEFEQIWPKAGTPLKLTEFGRKLLKQCETVKKPEQKEVDINEFKRKSSNFPLEVKQFIWKLSEKYKVLIFFNFLIVWY